MKKYFLAAILAVALAATSAFAVYTQAVPVEVKFSTTTVGTSTWVPVVTNSALAIKGISIFNSSPDAFYVGIAGQSATANTETAQVLVPGAISTASGAGAPGAIFYPLSLGQNVRISIKKLASTATTGVADLTFFYN